MSNDGTDKSADARKGLVAGVAGKVKEAVGALANNAAMVEKGRIQQAEAQRRKDSLTEEALANAKKQQAAEELREANHKIATEREDAQDRADKAQRAVEKEKAAEHAEAERIGAQQEAIGRRAAEQRADDLAATRMNEAREVSADAATIEEEAQAERERLEREAAAAEQKAAQLRDQTRSHR